MRRWKCRNRADVCTVYPSLSSCHVLCKCACRCSRLGLEKLWRKSSSGLCLPRQLSRWLYPKDLTAGSSLEWGVLFGAVQFLHQTCFCTTCFCLKQSDWQYWVVSSSLAKPCGEATCTPYSVRANRYIP